MVQKCGEKPFWIEGNCPAGLMDIISSLIFIPVLENVVLRI